MKKVLIIVAILSLVMVGPAFGFGDTEVNTDIKNSKLQAANGDGNVGLQSNGAMKDNIVVGGGNDIHVGNNVNKNHHNTTDSYNNYGNVVEGDGNVVDGNKQKQGQVQGQQQGQVQGQQQSNSNEVDNSANNSNKNKQETNVTFNEAENKRNLTGPPVLSGVVPAGAAFNETATPTGNVQKLQNVLIFKATFTYKQLKALKGTMKWSERAKLRAKYFDTEKNLFPKDDDEITAVLAVIDDRGNVARPAGDYRPVVHLTVEGKSSTTTVSAFSRVAIAAMKGGCDRVVITGEGAKRIMEAGGFGLMLGSSVMTISESGQKATGTATVGGLGFASSHASYGYSPWLQGFGIISE